MSLFNNKQIDLLAIGDIAIDAFIRLQNASVHCNVNHNDCEICMTFGDKIPYEFSKVISGVGNSANAAVSASRLGLTTALLASVGDDIYGKDALKALNAEGVNTKSIKIEKGKPTNYHYVLWYESERTILIHHTAYTYTLNVPSNPKWLYLSSLSDHTESYHDEIATYLEKNKEVKLAFQPGTFQLKLGAERLQRIYKRSDLFICNVEEAKLILKDENADIKTLLQRIYSLGPKMVLITDGPKGAYLFDGTKMLFQSTYPDPKPAYERTGAGDAFASTFVSALIAGKTTEEALQWAPINSMSVVQYVGAQEGLLSRPKLEEYLSKAPQDYSPKTL